MVVTLEEQELSAGLLSQFLKMNWLRPETVVWDTVASEIISQSIPDHGSMLEIGIGNGFFSFMTLGGRFSDEFDWYHSTMINEFWSGGDIFDSAQDASTFIIQPPRRRIQVAIDHKENLLLTATSLEFLDEVLVQDANAIVLEAKYDLIYSNCLYWLLDPVSVIEQCSHHLSEGGRLVFSFPNSRFLEYCKSYTESGRFFQLLNRGRAQSVFSPSLPGDFSNRLTEVGLGIESTQHYLGKTALEFWDTGLRPYYAPIISHIERLEPAERSQFKSEWCEHVFPLIDALYLQERDEGSIAGGFDFYVLSRT